MVRNQLLGENVMEHMSSGCWRVRGSCLCVDMFQKVMVRFAGDAMNCSCFGRAMLGFQLVSGTGHSETFEPVTFPFL